jgi:hypothetical protein
MRMGIAALEGEPIGTWGGLPVGPALTFGEDVGERGAGTDPQLAVYPTEVRLDGLGDHEPLGGDLLVGQTGRGQLGDMLLGGREPAAGAGPELQPVACAAGVLRPLGRANLVEQARVLVHRILEIGRLAHARERPIGDAALDGGARTRRNGRGSS